MNERVLKKNQVIEIAIQDMAFGGVGIGRIETEQGLFAVFVQNTIPGQVVKAVVTKASKKFAECRLVEVISKSPDEVEIPYQPIPGAPYASLPISKQVDYKKKGTMELFRRIGKIDNPESLFDEFIKSPLDWHYRNKMEYSFSVIRYDLNEQKEYDDFGLGFKHRGTWWCVENLDCDSGLFDEQLENELHQIREWCTNSGLPAWHPPAKHGFYRYLVARKTFDQNKLLINLVTSAENLEKFDSHGFTIFLKGLLGERLAGLIHTVNPHIGDRVDPLHGTTTLLCGVGSIVEKVNGLTFHISMESFFQTNPLCAEKLYSKVLEYAGAQNEDDGKLVLDLFCGTGTIAQLLAKPGGRKVIGVDIVQEAIQDAAINAANNQLENVEFIAADAGKFLSLFPQYIGKIACVVLDPPRSGIAPSTLIKVLALQTQRIVYVSCNPATQARDTEIICNSGYELKKFSLVDQFPHTSHIESIAWFEKIA